MIKKNIFLFIGLLSFLSGCSSTGKSIGLGASTGGVLGAGVGALADPGSKGENRFRNVVIGTGVGAALGAGTGFLLDQHFKDNKESAKRDGKNEAEEENQKKLQTLSSGASPKLIPAKTEARFVPEQVKNNIFIPAHFEYLIIENARWEISR